MYILDVLLLFCYYYIYTAYAQTHTISTILFRNMILQVNSIYYGLVNIFYDTLFLFAKPYCYVMLFIFGQFSDNTHTHIQYTHDTHKRNVIDDSFAVV